MQVGVYAIYDSKMESFSAPFTSQTNAHAVRMFADMAKDTSTMIGRHPEDFALWCLGAFDDAKGTFIHLSDKFPEEKLASALNLLPAS